MDRDKLLDLVNQDTNDYDEEIDGWITVTVRGNVLTVEVEHAEDHSVSTASWHLIPE